jgi:hypothetical protein
MTGMVLLEIEITNTENAMPGALRPALRKETVQIPRASMCSGKIGRAANSSGDAPVALAVPREDRTSTIVNSTAAASGASTTRHTLDFAKE